MFLQHQMGSEKLCFWHRKPSKSGFKPCRLWLRRWSSSSPVKPGKSVAQCKEYTSRHFSFWLFLSTDASNSRRHANLSRLCVICQVLSGMRWSCGLVHCLQLGKHLKHLHVCLSIWHAQNWLPLLALGWPFCGFRMRMPTFYTFTSIYILMRFPEVSETQYLGCHSLWEVGMLLAWPQYFWSELDWENNTPSKANAMKSYRLLQPAESETIQIICGAKRALFGLFCKRLSNPLAVQNKFPGSHGWANSSPSR